MKKSIHLLWYFLLCIAVITLDRITKYLVLAWLPAEGYSMCPLLRFEVVFNRGISWGLFHSSDTSIFVVISALIVAIIGLLLVHTYHAYMQGQWIVGEALVCAGALSNVIDRISFGAVVDFILLSCGRWSWPIFNVADIAVVIGVCLMLVCYKKK